MKKPLVTLKLNPASKVEMTPEIQDWLDKVSKEINASISEEDLEKARHDLAVYGTTMTQVTTTPEGRTLKYLPHESWPVSS